MIASFNPSDNCTSIEEDLQQALEKRRMEKEKEMQEKRKVALNLKIINSLYVNHVSRI